eukprot:6642_1
MEAQQSDSLFINEQLKSTTLEFNDGNIIPIVGLATQLSAEQDKKDDEKEERAFKQAIFTAIKYGYRHIDTAPAYRTEKIIASALNELYTNNIIRREDIFITSKIPHTIREPDGIRNSINNSLKNLNTKYIDLMLIHSPHTYSTYGKRGNDVIEMYKILHQYKNDGKIKSIGVSNFGVKHLEILEKSCPTLLLPVCNQVECHPFWHDNDIINYCNQKGILIESCSPTALANIARNNETLISIAKKYKVTCTQIMLRWQIQRGFILLPEIVTSKQIISNGNIFNLIIDDDDMNKLNALNTLNIPWDDNSKDNYLVETDQINNNDNKK